MIVLKGIFWFSMIFIADVIAFAAIIIYGIYLLTEAFFKWVWQIAFPKRLFVNSYGRLTSEEELDANNYYRGKIRINPDGIDWEGVRS